MSDLPVPHIILTQSLVQNNCRTGFIAGFPIDQVAQAQGLLETEQAGATILRLS
jgi:hypothetical protein